MDRRQTIVIADGSAVSLAAGNMALAGKYKVFPVLSAEELFNTLDYIVPDLILCDMDIPGIGVIEAMRALGNPRRAGGVPVVLTVAGGGFEKEREGLLLGAADVISKPYSAPLFLKRIENVLLVSALRAEIKNCNDNVEDAVRQKTRKMAEQQDAVLNAVADMIEFRDGLTGGHVARTRKFLELLTCQLVLDGVYADLISSWDLEALYASAQLHDVGKIAVSDRILNKPDRLSADEYGEVKRHATAGADAIRRMEGGAVEGPLMRHARNIAAAHHEKWDGTGYPAGLRGYDIPLEGRLMAVADVYDALVSPRPYKKQMTCGEAERVIANGSGTHFDPAIVGAFKKVSPKFAQVAHGHR